MDASDLACDEGGECGVDCMCTELGLRCDCECSEDGDYCVQREGVAPAEGSGGAAKGARPR